MIPTRFLPNGWFPKVCFVLVILGTIGFLGMWVVGHWRYTSVGVDDDLVEGDRVLATYYRLRWPGDGSFWIGAAAHHRPLEEKPPERWDLGGAFFKKPEPLPPKSMWNRLGFWWVSSADDDPVAWTRYPGVVWSRWIAVPGWLPALLLALWPLRRLIRRWRSGV